MGVVYGSGGGDYTSVADKLEASQNDLRNKTAALGGNFVLMDVSAADERSLSISGHALSCSSGEPTGALAVAPVATTFAVDTPSAAVSSAPRAPTPAPNPEQRLRTLDDLHQKGLITDSEYQERRKQVLDGI